MPDLYYDPQTGEAVPLTIIAERYTAMVAALVARPALANTRAADLPGLRAFGAKCRGCGVSVANDGDVCAVCIQRPVFQPPLATVIMQEQPAPAYAQPASERVTADDSLPAGTVIGGASGDGY